MNSSRDHQIFELLLPTTLQTLLLKAGLNEGEDGQKALHSWINQSDRPVEDLADRYTGARLLTPLIYSARRTNTHFIPKDLLTYMRSARISEELRSHTYDKVCHELLATCIDKGVQCWVLKGLAIASMNYPDRALRHCHDIDIFIRSEQVEMARQIACELGFCDANGSPHHFLMTHKSGLPLRLHTRFYRLPQYNLGKPFTNSGFKGRVVGVEVNMIYPHESLAHILLQAASYPPHPCGLLWVCDAFYLLKANPNLDWDSFLGLPQTIIAGPILSTLLGYLSREFSLKVPEEVMEALGQTGMSRTDFDVALFGIRGGIRPVRTMLAALPALSSKFRILRWLIFPLPSAVVGAGQVESGKPVIAYYVSRLKLTRLKSILRFRGRRTNQE